MENSIRRWEIEKSRRRKLFNWEKEGPVTCDLRYLPFLVSSPAT